jgi:hypothetical protein
VRSRERDGCLGGKLDLVRTFHGMYRWFGVVHHGGFPVSFVLIFGALCWRCFEDDFLGFLVGVTYEVLVPLWLVTLPQISFESDSIWWFLELCEFLTYRSDFFDSS